MAALNGYYILPKPPRTSSSRRCCCFSTTTFFPRSPSSPSSSSSSSNPFPLLTPKHRHPSSFSSSALHHHHHHHLYGSRSKRRIHCSCSSSETDVVELPLFPLPLVLFPGAILPLQIFEFRYRILMHTLLQTDLRFGVVFSDSGSAAGVGCVAEVIKHEGLADDRFFLICKGQERFRVTRIVRTKPYLVGEVLWLEDRPHQRNTIAGDEEGDDDPESLAAEVERHMRDVIRLSNRLNGKKNNNEVEKEAASAAAAAAEGEGEGGEEEVSASMDLRKNLFPTPFSFFVGSTFEGAPREQQALLEMEDTVARLRRERDTLRNTLNYLTAASAVNDVFPSSSSSSSSSSS